MQGKAKNQTESKRVERQQDMLGGGLGRTLRQTGTEVQYKSQGPERELEFSE